MVIKNKVHIKSSASARFLAIAILSTAVLSGCNTSNTQGSSVIESKVIATSVDKSNTSLKSAEDQLKLMESFKSLLGENSGIVNIIKFIDTNISQVSKENASFLLNEFEKMQKKYLPTLEDRYYKEEGIQASLGKVYKPDFEINKIDSIEDTKLKQLLVETRDSGYKLETAEGMFFPIINYEFYKKYNIYVTSDIKDYIEIMAVESNKVPAKDAALVITWDELVNRALSQEKFITQNKNSIKLQEVKNL